MKNLYLLLLVSFFFTKNLTAQVITSPNPVICGSNTSAVLTASTSGTYQWSFSANDGVFTNISGATSSSHTTTTVGFYKVLVNSVLSPAYRVSTTPYAIIKNASGTTSPANISAGQTTNLTIELYGQAPFSFSLNDPQNSRLYYSSTNTMVVPVTPATSRFYSISIESTSCASSGYSTNNLLINVNPAPSFTIGTIASTVCAGGVLDIPITKTGTWDNNVDISLSLYNSSNIYVAGNSGHSGNTLKYQVPTSIPNGTYRVLIGPFLPFTGYSNTYTPFFTVTNTGCTALPQASINSLESACSFIVMRPVPAGTGYVHKWYKDNNLVATTTDNNFYEAKESGTYHVVITNTTTGYNSTSATKSISITGVKPLLTSPNSSICGTNTSTTISTTTTGAGYTYQWRKYNTTTFKHEYLAGETNSTLTVTSAGQYSIVLNDGTCSNVSNYTIASTSSGVLSNAAGNQNAVNLAPGQTENLKLTLGGVGPWSYTFYEGTNIAIVKTSSVAQVTLPVTPAVATQYSVSTIVSASGSGCTNGFAGNVVVNVSPNPVLTYATPTMTTVCPGGVITIPYNLTGNVGTNRDLKVSLYTNSGTFINTGSINGQSSNPIYYQVPNTVAAGTYKFQISANVPYVNSIGFSPYTFDVVTTGCPAIPQAIIQSFENACNNANMTVVPSGAGYAFQWYKDNVLISGATFSSYNANLTGAYKVVVTNASTGYNSTSADKNITVAPKPILTSPNSSICGSNTSATISTTATGTYQWRKYNTVTFQNDILAGQTSSSITVTVAGQYSVVVDDGSCVTTSNNFTVSTTSNGVLTNAAGNNNPVNLNPGQTENLQLTLGGVGPWTYTLVGNNYSINTSTTSVSPVTIPVTPSVSTNYFVGNISSACGSGGATSTVLVNVSPNPSFTFGTMATSTCPGGYLEIPTIRSGNWGASGTQIVYLSLYTSAGAYVSSINGNFSSPTMLINVPSNVVVGNSYKIYVSPSVPSMGGSFSPNFTISNTCPAPPNATIQEQNSACLFPTLTAIPNGAYTFQWKKDGVDIVGATNYTYSPKVSGNYSVNIQNSSISYNSTSAVSAVTVNAITPPISSANSILCGANTSATISTSYTGAGYTYTWYKSNLSNGGSNAVVAGATGSSITVTDVGRYYVLVNNGTCSFQSATQVVSYGATGSLLNSNNTSDIVVLAPSQTENLKVNLTGTGPWEVGFNDGTKVKTYYTATSPLIIPVSPTSKTSYSLEFVSNACGLTPRSAIISNRTIVVDVTPSITFTTPTPSNLTVCKGNFIDIPYTLSGTLGSSIGIGTLLADAVGGSSRGVYTFKNFILEPPTSSGNISLYIPYDVATGSYSIYMGTNNPETPYTFTNYAINVVTTGCAATPAPTIMGLSSACESVILESSIYNGFNGSGANTFQWYKNGVALTGKTNSQLTVYESGNYTVQVINTSASYNQTSAAKTVTINRVIPIVTTTNPVVCGSNTTATLTSSLTGAGYTYQWYKDRNFSNGTTEQIPIFGETNSSLTVSNAGGYSVRVFDGACLQNSKSSSVDVSGSLVPTAAFAVSNTATAKLTNLAGDNTALTIGGATTSATLRVNFTGGGPWSFDLVGSDGNTTAYTNVTTQVYDFTVSPIVNTNYNIANLTSSCGVGLSSGNLTVIVSPPPSFVANAPSAPNVEGEIKSNSNTNICPGSSITIGYTISGNWSTDRNMVVELVNASTNAVIAGTTQNGYNTNPILYFVPYNVPVGTYKLKLTSTKPFIETGVLSSTVTITNTACSTPQATVRSKSSCSSSLLSATPSGSGFTYQWYNGATLISNAISSDYNATADGNYSVTITNTAQGYTATSAAYVVAIEEINSAITASSGSICNAGGNVTFTSNNVGGSYTHQWYSSSDNVFFSPISGATANTYSATTAGYYNVIIKNTGCELKSNTLNTCVASINFSTKTVCANAGVNVPFSFSGGENQAITIQLVDATTNAVVQANLLTVNSTIATLYSPTVNIPNSVTAGTYKFKLITAAPSNVSIISNGVLTVSNQTGGIAPIVSASIGSVNSQQNVTITAIGCVGDITWNNSDQIVQSFPSFTSLVSKNTTYSAICKDFATGCVSAEGSTTVTYNCADAYEPNNSIVAATEIAPNTFTSPVLCLNGFDNPDWFSWNLNGHVYYIKAALTSSQVSAGNYKIKLSYDNTNLTIETIPETVGQSLDTYLTLFDTDGVTVLSMNDNGNGNGFSKIVHALANINPCVSALTLNNITDDISSGTIIKQANATTGTITATNKITGTANVTYRAGKSITLEAGFKADNGVVFKTEFGGCN